MIKKIVDMMKSGLMGVDKLNSLLDSRLFTGYSCTDTSDGDSRQSYFKLLGKLKSAFCIYGDYNLLDAISVSEERITLGNGLYYASLKGIPVFIRIVRETSKDKPYSTMTLFVPTLFKKEFEPILISMIPPNKKPSHYSLNEASGDHRYSFRLRSTARLGALNLTHAEVPIMDPEPLAVLEEKFERFINDRDYYVREKKCYREVGLVYGPPGTGKTSISRYFLSKYKMNLIEYSPEVNPAFLRQLIGELTDHPNLIIIEDIDAYDFLKIEKDLLTPENEDDLVEQGPFTTTRSKMARHNSKKYSNFINLLDGITPLENCFVIFTTNYPEELKPSLYRMGRATFRLEINYPKESTICSFLQMDETDERWTYVKSLEDNRLPLDAIYRIRSAETVDDVKAIIADRDHALSLKDKKSYDTM